MIHPHNEVLYSLKKEWRRYHAWILCVCVCVCLYGLNKINKVYKNIYTMLFLRKKNKMQEETQDEQGRS